MNDKKMQLFIFPYAGGSKASFQRLTNLLNDDVEVITVEYSGRGSRSKEPFASDIWMLMDDATKYCNERRKPEIPYAIMGYSMGSVIAYEIAARNLISGILKHMFICAEIPPALRVKEFREFGAPTDERLLERAKKLGGLNEHMLNNKRFADIYIKPMLSDCRLFFDYDVKDTYEKIKANTTIFYCEKDTAYEDVKKWDELIDGKLDYYELGKNHFFINEYVNEMANVMNRELL